MSRTVVWFSAGAASAVAAKITLSSTPDAVVAYTDPGAEHPDNERFISDCEAWFGCEVQRLKSSRYADTWQVFEERRFLNSPRGALCTTEMKKMVRQDFEQPGDIQVFGYTSEEAHRADRFRAQNPDVNLRCPLIERSLTKDDCLALIERSGIELPAMYKLGYLDFPDVFNRMAGIERDIGISLLKADDGPVYLDELQPDRGNHQDEPSFECSLLCADVESEMAS